MSSKIFDFKRIYLDWDNITNRVEKLANEILKENKIIKIYGIPRGGVIVAGLLHTWSNLLIYEENPKKADIIVDDIWDTGITATKYFEKYKKPIKVLVDKRIEYSNQYIIFPWEKKDEEKTLKDYMIRILESCNWNLNIVKNKFDDLDREIGGV